MDLNLSRLATASGDEGSLKIGSVDNFLVERCATSDVDGLVR